MATKKAIISTSGFPQQYFVLQANEEGIYEVVFGPDPDLEDAQRKADELNGCLLYTSPSPRDRSISRMPSSA